ncbi:DNA topoisomerase I [Methanothermobacter tenebrarum]|uniref:DNA topoisomerase 1 n=1 Tax=Methanothermobacter tenebrarum TaxID=680118 RepID=A0A328P9F1_9EURY|nr:DNA topoisomerase I [Methanothermobacter tenebrarum]MBC7100886.1 DNA topoisomerase I [Methanobacteriales archaeon]NPV64026.1 DNA topoisomerase I [Methanobacteriaceae archaeon]RAO79198.1 DNA topoisomerase I [Methanothermobacter tenebrarum]
MDEVIICEKPRSSEKIAKALFPNAKKKKYKKTYYWEHQEKNKKTIIIPAVGHLYTLKPKNPNDELFFDLEWAPVPEVDKKKRYVQDYIDAIDSLAKNADRYFHACDYDIEGTLIGYNVLKHLCGDEALQKTLRMKFSTLTRDDIIKAYENPIELDYGQVDSGIARHVLDFIFGVNISRSLMKSVKESTNRFIKLSAGRVQTPALSILVDREKAIRNFKPEPYWIIKAILEDDIIALNQRGRIFQKNKVKSILGECQGKDAIIEEVKINRINRMPPPPFNLGGLQAEAYRIFGLSPKKTQSIAQNLYLEGYISYPRTSSQKLPKTIKYEKIFKGLSKDPRFKEKIKNLKKPLKPHEGKKEDEAHPAIHPTGLLPKKLGKHEKKVYELIVYRFISAFSEKAIIESMNAKLNIGGEIFKFSRKKVAKKGWMKQYPYQKIEDEKFPLLKEGEKIPVKEIIAEEKETKPPARYNEASLIKEMEKRGLGTKSTRADIISILYDRKYIEGKKIRVTPLGENIIDTLKRYCEKITSEELTRQFEEELKKIMKGKTSKDKIIKKAKEEIISIIEEIEKNKEEIGKHLYKAYQKGRIIGKCPECEGNLLIRYSDKTKSSFVGCSRFPECKIVYPLPKGARILKSKCEKCGLPLISYGRPRQRACLDPHCGKSKKDKMEVVGKCPKCGNDLVKRSGRYGEFIGCKGFPKCRFTASIEEVIEKG